MFKGPFSIKGLTLIEIIFVIVLLGIITVVAIPRFRSDFSTKQRVKSEAQEIVSNIRYTRRLAVTDKDASQYIISFDYAGSNYGIYLDSVAPSNLIGSLITIPPEISASGETEITFYDQGNCTFPGTGEININSGSNNYKITVQSATGKVRLIEN